MTTIIYGDINELKQLKTPRTVESYMQVMATKSFVIGFGRHDGMNITKGDIIEIGHVYDTFTTIYGRSISIAELKEKTRPFAWTRSARRGYEKATIYPWE